MDDRTPLRRLRDSKAYSIAEVSEITGLATSAIWSLEKGRRPKPQPRTLRLLAQCYGVTPDAIRAALAPVEAA